jgi:hypothetical protein
MTPFIFFWGDIHTYLLLTVIPGLRGREIAVQEFAVEKFITETLAVYRELLNHRV